MKNIVFEQAAGTGKTTNILNLCLQGRTKNNLLLTYNKLLKDNSS